MTGVLKQIWRDALAVSGQPSPLSPLRGFGLWWRRALFYAVLALCLWLGGRGAEERRPAGLRADPGHHRTTAPAGNQRP